MVRLRPVPWSEERFSALPDSIAPGDTEEAVKLVGDLGALASWWLEDHILKAAEAGLGSSIRPREALRRASSRSAMLPLLHWAKNPRPGILRPAFALPLRWTRAPADDSRLPPAFRALAEGIRAALGEERFHLELTLDDRGADLAGLPLAADSAWALLAAGLLLAREGRSPRPDVSASAAFDPKRGPAAVTGLPEKLAEAGFLGCRLFYVSPADEARARVIARDPDLQDMEVAALDPRTDPRGALEPLRVALEIPPGRESPLEERIRHFLRLLPVRRTDARAYYREDLLDDLLRAVEAQEADRCAPYRGLPLVTMLSRSPEVSLFVPRVIRPAACLVLCTEESRPEGKDRACADAYRRIREICPEGGDAVILRPPLHEAAAEAVRLFARRMGSRKVVVDLTPGPRHVAIAAYGAVPRERRIGVYLLQKWDAGNRRPGGEELVWIPGDAMAGEPHAAPTAPPPAEASVGEASWTAEAAALLEPLRPRLLRFDVVPRAQIRFGPNPGSVLRVTLGAALRDVACPEPEPCGEECRGNPRCLHALLFGTGGAAGEGGRKARPFRTRPLVIRVRTGGTRRVEKGVQFGIELLLLGPLRERAREIIRGIEETGRRGLGSRRVPFEVVRVSRVDASGREIPVPHGEETSSRGTWEDRAPAGLPPPPGTGRARVEFRTRTRLVHRGSLVTHAPFPLLVRAVLRRYVGLREAWGDGRPAWDLGEIVRRAEEVGTVLEDLRFADASRWSTRQERRVPEGGILGAVDYAGPLAPFAGLLQAAEVLHVGKGTLLGQGEIRVTFS